MSDERRLPGSADAPRAEGRSGVRLPSEAPSPAPGSASAPRPELPSDSARPQPAPSSPTPPLRNQGAVPTPARPRSTATPGRPSQALSLGPAALDPELADRIRETTARGGLTALPERWGDEDGDWRTITSPNSFEILYLDYQSPDAINAELLERHHDFIRDFWKKKDADMSRGAGAVRERSERTYGRDVPRFAGIVSRAFQQLSGPGGIAAEASRINHLRRDIGEAGLTRAVAVGLGDGLLTITEADEILKLGPDEGLTRDETAAYMERVLAERGFEPESNPSGTTAAERLLSVRWMTAAYKAESLKATTAIRPFHFGNGVMVGSLAELVDVCDARRTEAEEFLFGGYFVSWLSNDVNDISLAKTAQDIVGRWRQQRAKGLEKFVRAVSGRANRPESPVIVASPAQWSAPRGPMGATASVRIALDRQARPTAWGTIALDETLRGMTVPARFEPNDSSFEISLSTLHVPPGHYWGRITVQPEGGMPLNLPVEYEVLPLTMVANPPMVDFGLLRFGVSATTKLMISTTPAGGYLEGDAEVLGDAAGISVAAEVRGSSFEIVVSADTRKMVAGARYAPVIRLRTTAGTLDVPVSVGVALNTPIVAAWSIGGALMGALLFGIARSSAAAFGFGQWHNSLAGHSPAESVAMSAVPIAATMIIGGVFLKRRKKPVVAKV